MTPQSTSPVASDPYLLWAHDSNYAGYKQPPNAKPGFRTLPLAIELKAGTKPTDLPTNAKVPKAYISSAQFSSRFVTLTIPENDIAQLLPWVSRLKLGLPSTPALNFVEDAQIDAMGSRSSPLMGFIDHGIGFLNTRFWHNTSRGNESRIIALWDQEETKKSTCDTWKSPFYFEYGRQLTATNLHCWLAKNRKNQSEHEVYAALDYPPAAGRAGHGTHVMDIAAGGSPVSIPANDSAGATPIIAVQLPWSPFKDTSGASLCVHILDGLRYIMKVAGTIRPVIINISDGAYAGPQFGASLLESAIDDLVQREFKNLTVVIAAGNGREQRLHGSFTSSTKTAPPLWWRVLPDIKTDSFMEIWCDKTPKSHLKITSPEGLKHHVKLGQQILLLNAQKEAIGGVYTSADPTSNGTARALFLIALASTRPGRTGRTPAPHGIWKIEVSGP